MSEESPSQSHWDAMNAAIRAQRERANVPKSMLPPEDEPVPVPVPPAAPEPMTPEPPAEPAKRGLFTRLLGRA